MQGCSCPECYAQTAEYKLIEFHTKNEWEFYDPQKDPLEMNSDHNNHRYEKIISDMKNELTKLMSNYQLG